jgi:glycosyltransferase involved in cell wall biosynthesis
MKKSFPYIILHVQLEGTGERLLLPLLESSAYYCIFWWEQIPLGQLFIEPGANITGEHLENEVATAIQPALDYYVSQTGFTSQDNIPSFFAQRRAFAEMMDKVSASYNPPALNDVVDVSIVVCTRNRSKYLKRCLEVLQKQQCRPHEIIVVDNAPTDSSTFDVVQKFGNDVQYVREPRPGLDIARNTGAARATGSVIAYVDDDVFVHPLWTCQISQTFRDSKVAAATGLVIASALDTESQQIFEKYWSFNRGYTDRTYDHEFLNRNLADGPPVWEIGAGANMAFRKSIFDEVGYFDERLDVGAAGCSGDSELWYRILAKGFIIHYNPRAIVYHEHRQELEALHKQLFNYMRGHAAAALIQQSQNEQAGYRRRIFNVLPEYYSHLLREGFPMYKRRYRTVFTEIRGLLSGIIFYRKHKARPSKIFPGNQNG